MQFETIPAEHLNGEKEEKMQNSQACYFSFKKYAQWRMDDGRDENDINEMKNSM